MVQRQQNPARIVRFPAALRIALCYFAFGAIWILISDRVVATFVADADEIIRVQMIKGWVYVFLTALLVYLLVVREIAARRKVENALRESEHRYAMAARASKVGVWEVCPEHGSVKFDDSMARMVGYQRDELDENIEHWIQLVPPEEQDNVRAGLDRVMRGESRHYHVEHRLLHKDGSTVWVSMRGFATPAPDDTHHIVGTAVDITERRRAEEALRESEHQLRVITDAVPVLIVYVDDRQCYRFNNRAYRDWFGLSPHELFGLHLRDAVGEENYDVIKPYVERALAGEAVTYEHQRVIPGKNNERRWLSATYVPDIAADGRVRGFFGVVADINERRRIEEQRNELQEQLHQAQKMEAIGQLAGGVAHDFNNLLTVIMGAVDQLRELVPESEPESEQALDAIRRATEQATGVTRSLLTFSHKLPSKRAPTDLCNVIERATRLLRRLLPASIELQTDLPADAEIWVDGDSTQLQQVVLNLAINARDAMPEGGRLVIAVSRRASGQPDTPNASRCVCDTPHVCIDVIDTGHGMTPQVQQRIFEPFYTTKPREQGTGLGLAIVHSVVVDHGGEVSVASEPGQGTHISVCLPCLDPADREAPSQSLEEPRRANGELILLAEDHRAAREIMAAKLESLGYRVLQAEDGEVLTRAFADRGDQVRLLVLDVDLPRRNGLDFLRETRNANDHTPAIIITGGTDMSLDEIQDEHTRVLRKPFRMVELGTVVRDMLASNTQSEKSEHAKDADSAG